MKIKVKENKKRLVIVIVIAAVMICIFALGQERGLASAGPEECRAGTIDGEEGFPPTNIGCECPCGPPSPSIDAEEELLFLLFPPELEEDEGMICEQPWEVLFTPPFPPIPPGKPE